MTEATEELGGSAGAPARRAVSAGTPVSSTPPYQMNDAAEDVVLVDAEDREIGAAPKLAAHRQGLKHRAISVLIRNSSGALLLQERARSKYHSGGLLTNATCSHPRRGETTAAAAERRLFEEMGVRCPLTHLFTTSYRGPVAPDLIEDELVHVFGGRYDGVVTPNPYEADGYQWVSPADLKADVARRPERYTIWLRHYVSSFEDEATAFL